jgi:pimeloyl-ACP methyl ester carboxylesterase
VLIDPFAFMPWYFKIFVAGDFGRAAYYSTFANPIGRWATNLSLKRRRTSRTHLTRSFGSVDHGVSQRYLRLLSAVEGVAQFGSITAPVDIAYGEKTFGAIKRSARLWQGVWPRARCTELCGAGHLPILEATEQLSEIIFAPERIPAARFGAPGSPGEEKSRAVSHRGARPCGGN